MSLFQGSINKFIELVKNDNKKIICYGVGKMLDNFIYKSSLLESIECLIDSDINKIGKKIKILDKEFCINDINILENYDSKNFLILITSGYYNEIIEKIYKSFSDKSFIVAVYPIINITYDNSEEFFKNRVLDECINEYRSLLKINGLDFIEIEKKIDEKSKYIIGDSDYRPLVIPRIMIMPTTKCNFTCIGCSSLLPLFDNPQDVDINQIIKDFDIFFSAIDECIRITIGGEPFLYKDLDKILEYLISQDKVLGILMITNSTIVPKNNVIELLKYNKIYIEISDYGHLEKMSKLVSLFEKENIKFEVLTQQYWTDMGNTQKRNRSLEELRFSYLNCEQSRLIKGFHDGYFYTCARSARLKSLGIYDAKEDSFKFSDYSVSEIRKKIQEMYYEKDIAISCDYCDLGTLPNKIIDAGIQKKENMKKSEYTIVKRSEYEKLKINSKLKE
ncbi:radical SAM protein [Peptoanaerobacter stomatis]|uniref:radical SAM protein n=1 Tax=Peptoanaerobacter stomatis TaxID=796937 RepID=UPI003F9F55B2